jgi:hypothetical protein
MLDGLSEDLVPEPFATPLHSDNNTLMIFDTCSKALMKFETYYKASKHFRLILVGWTLSLAAAILS